MTGLDILVQIAPRIAGNPACSIVEAINTVLPIVASRLVQQRSRWSRHLQSVTVVAEAGAFSLPATVGGITGPIRLVGDTAMIVPVPVGTDLTAAAFTMPSIPVYYEVYGTQLVLYPPNSTDIDVVIPLQKGVLPLSSETDLLPWDGVFDSFFVEACYHVLAKGSSVCATPEFQQLLITAIDSLVQAEKMVSEQEWVDRTFSSVGQVGAGSGAVVVNVRWPDTIQGGTL